MNRSSCVYQYRRVQAHVGKHGAGDFRASIAGTAPTHGELLALLCIVLKAERRYSDGGALGPYLLWTYIDALAPLVAKTWDDITALAIDADAK